MPHEPSFVFPVPGGVCGLYAAEIPVPVHVMLVLKCKRLVLVYEVVPVHEVLVLIGKL